MKPKMTGIDTRYVLGWLFERQVGGVETSWSDFAKAYGPWDGSTRSKKCAKQTFINHKKRLEAEGKLRKTLSRKTGRPIYYVPDHFQREAELARMLYRLENASTHSLDALDATLKEMFDDAAQKITIAILSQVKSWLRRKGYANLADDMDMELKLRKIKFTFKP
jgi:hypothetical protein